MPVVREPAPRTPALLAGAFRRTSHVRVGPRDPDGYGVGSDAPRTLHAVCCDVVAGPGGGVAAGPDDTATTEATLGQATLDAELAADHRIEALTVDPSDPDSLATILVGRSAVAGLRRLLAEKVEDLTGPRGVVLLDLPVGGSLSGYARMQSGRLAGLTTADVMPDGAIDDLADTCAGWAEEGEIVRTIRAGRYRRPKLPPEVPDPDLEGWHDLGPLPSGWVRRRRRIDVIARVDGWRVDAAFRDSWVDPDGMERALHEWELELEADRDGVVQQAQATPRSLPFAACPGVAANVSSLTGHRIEDLRRAMRTRLDGVAGCTHLNDLLSAIPGAFVRARSAGTA